MLRQPIPPRLVLIRGLPSSGKMTLSMEYQSKGYRHFEVDQLYEVDGKCHFNCKKLADGHARCLKKAPEALRAGAFVCVANVYAVADDIKPYTQLASTIRWWSSP